MANPHTVVDVEAQTGPGLPRTVTIEVPAEHTSRSGVGMPRTLSRASSIAASSRIPVEFRTLSLQVHTREDLHVDVSAKEKDKSDAVKGMLHYYHFGDVHSLFTRPGKPRLAQDHHGRGPTASCRLAQGWLGRCTGHSACRGIRQERHHSAQVQRRVESSWLGIRRLRKSSPRCQRRLLHRLVCAC